jgi:transcriptional regulator with XRE-family HTH domain
MVGGELVREGRKRAGLTQRQLADRADTTQSAIARLEAGRTTPTLESVERLLRLCGFQLIVELAPYDDSDIRQANAHATLSPEQRAQRLGRTVRRLNAMKASIGA